MARSAAVIAGAFFFGALLLGFQNCSPSSSQVNFANSVKDEAQGTGGQGYDGKIYVLLGTTCPDGSPIASQIVLSSATSGQLTRQNCQDLVPPLAVTAADFQIDPSNTQQIFYRNQVYVNTPPINITALPQALKMADFILSLQDPGGAIKEAPGGTLCNQDSSMEYALLGLAAAYVQSHDAKYLTGFEKGIAWLADREDMSATEWSGSWYNAYACATPYNHVAVAAGAGVADVRGVDTTSAYFPYLVYIHSRITQSDAFAVKYAAQAKAALEFLLRKNLNSEGLSFNSYQLVSGTWRLWPYQYTSGQADVFLGFKAGALLFDGADRRYGTAADTLKQKIPALFFDSNAGRFAVGRDAGALDWTNSFEGIFPQGYVPWVIGPGPQSMASYQWLASKAQANGSLICYANDLVYTLSAAEYLLAANAVGQPESVSTSQWLLNVAYSPQSGGLIDSLKDGTQYSNVAAFTILSLLKQGSMNW